MAKLDNINTGEFTPELEAFETTTPGHADEFNNRNRVLMGNIIYLKENFERQTYALTEINMLGWSVPKECPIQNDVDDDGIFHQVVGRVDLGELDYDKSDQGTFVIFSSKQQICCNGTYGEDGSDGYSPIYTTTHFNNLYETGSTYDMHISVNGADGKIYIRNSNYTDTAAFKDAMKGVYFYYKLAVEKTMTIDGNEAVTKVNDSLTELTKLGWTVPKECPIQNYVDSDGVFHQRVGRMELSNLAWAADYQYSDGTYRFQSSKVSDIKKLSDPFVMCSRLFCSKEYIADSSVLQIIPSDKHISVSEWGRLYLNNKSYTNTQVDALRNSLKGIYVYYELVNEKIFDADKNEQIMTGNYVLLATDRTTGEYGLSDKISNYKFLAMYISEEMLTVGSFIIPTSLVPFYVSETNDTAFGTEVYRLGVRCYLYATYKSDTQLYVQIPDGYNFSIYGIR